MRRALVVVDHPTTNITVTDSVHGWNDGTNRASGIALSAANVTGSKTVSATVTCVDDHAPLHEEP